MDCRENNHFRNSTNVIFKMRINIDFKYPNDTTKEFLQIKNKNSDDKLKTKKLLTRLFISQIYNKSKYFEKISNRIKFLESHFNETPEILNERKIGENGYDFHIFHAWKSREKPATIPALTR